jgi:hypothetical protein
MQHIIPCQKYHYRRNLCSSITTAWRGTRLYEVVLPRRALGSSLWNVVAQVWIDPVLSYPHRFYELSLRPFHHMCTLEHLISQRMCGSTALEIALHLLP